MSRPRRHLDLALPAAPYVPGRGPRPQGLCAAPALAPRALEAEVWRDNARWLHAADLYNAGFYWEAHEAWEGIWHVHGRRGPTADLLKALIQTAAAHLKTIQDVPRGRALLAGSSGRLLDALLAGGMRRAFGLDVAAFRARHAAWFDGADEEDFPFVLLRAGPPATGTRP